MPSACRSAAFLAESLRFPGRVFSQYAEALPRHLSRSLTIKKCSPGKAEPFREEGGRAAGFTAASEVAGYFGVMSE